MNTKTTKKCRKIKDKVCAAPECFILFTPWNSLTRACSPECALELVKAKNVSKAKREVKAKEKADKKQHRADKERIKKRTGKNGHYQSLKTALHYYVKHVLRKGEPCYTCGKQRSANEKPQEFHVGHFIPAKEVDPRRFMLENLRIQCYSCNVANSGKRAEYRQNLIEEVGLILVEWLERKTNHENLKDRYPDVADIKADAARYRKLTRKAES